MKIGLAKHMTKMVPMTLYNWLHNILKFMGMVTSMISTSLENLFKILPKGVVSKKYMGDLKIRVNMVKCNLDEANSVPTITQETAAIINPA